MQQSLGFASHDKLPAESFTDAMVHWCIGALVHWCIGAMFVLKKFSVHQLQ
jgi:hypothetical protein